MTVHMPDLRTELNNTLKQNKQYLRTKLTISQIEQISKTQGFDPSEKGHEIP